MNFSFDFRGELCSWSLFKGSHHNSIFCTRKAKYSSGDEVDGVLQLGAGHPGVHAGVVPHI